MTEDIVWWKELWNYGLPTGLLGLLCLGLWRACCFLGAKLFNEQTGYLTLWFRSQIRLTEQLSEASTQQLGILAQLRQEMAQLRSDQGEMARCQESIAESQRQLLEAMERGRER